MTRLWLGFILMLTAFVGSAAAVDCDSVVADEAGVLNANQIAEVTSKSTNLINQGADVRVRTVGMTPNIDATEQQYISACPSWQSADGKLKNTAIVLMVSPVSRKMGIFYGGAWHSALDAHWTRIKQDYMAPHFRDKDWSGGFIATEQQLTARLAASKDEALHPAQSTTVNQATDLSGLWWFLTFAAILGVLIGVIVMVITFLRKRKEEAQKVAEAQAVAITYRNQAASALHKIEQSLKIGGTKSRSVTFDAQSEAYAELASRERSNPDTEGLTTAEYMLLANQYKAICDRLGHVVGSENGVPVEPENIPDNVKSWLPTAQQKRRRRTSSSVEAPASQPASVSHVDNSIFAPVIINEEESPSSSRRSRDDDDDSKSSSSSSSSFGSGSSDSGGSSDFGSSDSGGGSSDFGSSDSGGGSSDF